MRPQLRFPAVARVANIAILVLVTLARTVHTQDGCMVGDRPHALASDAGDVIAPSPRTDTPRSRIRITDVRLRRSAESAVRSAAARVASPGCRGLLSEFVDQHGQPLAARLETLRMSLQDYLHTVIFVDGSAKRPCQGPVAVTMPGSRVVYLCTGLTEEPRVDAWVAIIHEVLHSLGLPENPPTPAYISNRVRTLCR